MRCGSVLLIRTSKKGRSWCVSHSIVQCIIGVLCINVIKEKGSILLRVEKTKCSIHLVVI